MLKRLTLQTVFALLNAFICIAAMSAIEAAANTGGGNENWFAGIEYVPVFFLFLVVVAPTLLAAGIYFADRLSGYGYLYKDVPMVRVFTSFANKSFIGFIVIEIAIICVFVLGGKIISAFLPQDFGYRYSNFSWYATVTCILYALIFTGSVNRLLSQRYSHITTILIVSWGLLCYTITGERYYTIIPLGTNLDLHIFVYVFAVGFAVLHAVLHPALRHAPKIVVTFLLLIAFTFFVLPTFSIDFPIGKFRYRDKVMKHIEEKDKKAIRKDIDYMAKEASKGNENARYLLSFTIRPLLLEGDEENMKYLGEAAKRIHWQPDSADRNYVSVDHITDIAATRVALQYKFIDPNKFYDDRGFLLNIKDSTWGQMLLQNGADPNAYFQSRRYYSSPPFSPLNYAVRQDDVEKAGFLLRHGASVSLGGANNQALCYVHSLSMAKLLVAYGAKPDSGFMLQNRNINPDAKAYLQEQGF